MGYFVVYCPEDDDADLVGGDQVASNSGYAAFVEWAAELRDGYVELAELADKGVLGSPEELEALEAQLARALRAKPDRPSPDVRGVARRLLAALRERPEGTAAMAVTDGTAGA